MACVRLADPIARFLPRDVRWFQIAALAALLAWGIARLGFPVTPWQVALVVATAQATQWLGTKLARLPAFDFKSALISALGLAILFRAGHPGWLALGAALSIGSKFLVRLDGRHLFNPTTFGMGALLLAGAGWISPGQWGTAAWVVALIVALGGMVVWRALRSETALVFLAARAALLVARSLRVGEPMTIPLHRMESGALLMFAFFMISDPKTTPDRRAGRVLHAALVALAAHLLQFKYFSPHALVHGLLLCSPLVPLINRVLPGARHAWTPVNPLGKNPEPQGASHVQPVPVPVRIPEAA